MSARLARTADGWWAVTPAGLARLDLPAATTAGLLADRTALTAAIEAAQATASAAPQDAVPAESLDLLSPVTAPARVVAQAVNYQSHAIDSGFDPAAVPPAFFRKASHSITGPAGDIIRADGSGSSTTRWNSACQNEQMVNVLLAGEPGVGSLDPIPQDRVILGQFVGNGQRSSAG